jgi:hypothetical protein
MNAALRSRIDHPLHTREQTLGIQRIREGRVAFEETLEEVDDDDGAALARADSSKRMILVAER